MLILIFKLLIGHAIADFALQNDAMQYKNRHKKPTNIPPGQKLMPTWGYWMTAHALIHAGLVYFITGLWWAALIQCVTHWVIDFAKCESWTNPNQDQALHFLVILITAALIAF